MKKRHLTTRGVPLSVRALPATLDEEARAVGVVLATEDPAEVIDWERWQVVPEVLLMAGVRHAAQLPLLDSHDRSSVEKQLGSLQDLRVEDDALLAKAVFSATPAADEALTKIKEGHLTDLSVGYRVDESVWIEEETTAEINGREFTGPMRVVTGWTAKEGSVTPVGADERAKVRSEENTLQEEIMTEEEKRKLAEEKKRAEEAESARNSSAPPLPTPAPATSTPAPSPAEIRAEEKARVSDITAIAARFDCPDLARAAIDDDLSVEEFRKAVLDHLDKKARENPPPGFRAEITADERDKFRAAAKDGLALRCGLSVETPAAGADVIRGLTLRELARESLRRAGEKPPSNVMEMIGRALTTSDLPLLLADSATQSLFAGWESQPETWRIWCGVDQVGNFLSHSQPRPSELDDLDEVPENAEFPFGSMTEATETYQIVTYGKRFAVSRQAIVNDDLGALTRIPAQHGEAAARKVGDVAYAVLTANAAMGDGTALFHANHSNLESGAAPDITALGSAIKAMKLQKDIGGNRTLNIRPNFFIGPVALELLVEQLLRSDKEGTQAKPGLVNPYAGTYFTRVYEPRLDDDSATAWYLAAPAGKTVTLFFLNGVQAPYLETKQGWSVDGTEYKVRIDVAAKALDWRGLIKNPGA